MAAKTPSSVKTYSMGDSFIKQATFTDLDDGDTWASGLEGVKGYWIVRTDDPTTQASVGIAVGESSGTFTFYPAEDNSAAVLYVMANDG